MKAITAIVLLGFIAIASAGILSPYVGYGGYYAAPVVSRVGVVSPYASAYVSPYVSRYYAAAPIAAPVAYSTGIYSPYAAYSYLLKK